MTLMNSNIKNMSMSSQIKNQEMYMSGVFGSMKDESLIE
jgi:hypothetical protein